MASTARRNIIPEGADCVVHALSRCVRRAWLCGEDPLSRRDLSHRREWIVERLRLLSSLFAIEVCAYSVMSNHYHLVLHCRPSVAEGWSALEVARRRLILRGKPFSPEDLIEAASTPEAVGRWRCRLGSLSWFMRFLNEWVARRANAEDECAGRFWEGRFHCQLLEDDAALLACMAYVDLNPVRAGGARGLEDSHFTSARERLERLRAEPKHDRHTIGADQVVGGNAHDSGWLVPMAELGGSEGIIAIATTDYLSLLEWTGQMRVHGKVGAIAAGVPSVLEGFGVAAESWLRITENFSRMFRRVAGRPYAMEERARLLNLRWLAGIRASRELLSKQAA